MNDAITEEDAVVGTEVDFYLKPSDKSPALKTTITETGYDDRDRFFIAAKGLNDWFPFYHFKKSTSTVRYGCEITNPLDDLQIRLGI